VLKGPHGAWILTHQVKRVDGLSELIYSDGPFACEPGDPSRCRTLELVGFPASD
jgi:hypothetical protein